MSQLLTSRCMKIYLSGGEDPVKDYRSSPRSTAAEITPPLACKHPPLWSNVHQQFVAGMRSFGRQLELMNFLSAAHLVIVPLASCPNLDNISVLILIWIQP